MRLNYLLAMPKLVQTVGDGYVFPLGMAYVSACLKAGGFNVFTVNLNHKEGDINDILREIIEDNDIDVIGTGGLSPQYHLIKSVIKAAKQIKPDIITIVGGGIITTEPPVAMEALEFADYGVIGEGDVTICEFAEALEQNKDMTQVAGLIFKQTDPSLITHAFITTAVREDTEDLDSLPWADYEGFDIDKYMDLPPPAFGGLNAKKMLPMLLTRSCPYSCTFCFHTLGSKYRRRSLDDFFAELDHLLEKYDIEYISMADELFDPKQENIKAFCERMEPYGLHWHADFAVNNVREELLPVMKSAGLNVMFFGLESADNSVLKSMRKALTVEEMGSTLEIVHKNDIPVYGAFIFGDPAETYATAQNTMQWWREHPEYLIHLTLIKPFPGSRIYDYACDNGLITDRVQYLKDGCPQINISQMSDREFALIGHEISESMHDLKKLENLEVLAIDPLKGRIAIQGECPSCHHQPSFEEVKLFALDYLTCPNCVQKFHIPLPDVARENLDRNFRRLMNRAGKVSVWGMTLAMMELFKYSEGLVDPRLFPVDVSESKACLTLNGQKVNRPHVLDEEDISIVVVAVPSHIATITCQIMENHPTVTEVYDICELVGPDLPTRSLVAVGEDSTDHRAA